MDPSPISLTRFLSTGEFGPLSSQMTRADVRECLGPPDDQIDGPDNEDDAGESSYWIYGYALEISFRRNFPYLVNWFAVDHLQFKTARFEDFGGRFSLDMDGLTWKSPPSAFLGRLLSENPEVQFELSSDHFSLRLFFGDNVEMFFVSSDPVVASPDTLATRHKLARTLRDIERHCLVESIYSFPQPFGREERLRMRTIYGSSTTWMTGNDYLALISE